MTFTTILVFSLIAFLTSWLVPAKWKTQAFLFTSLVSIYWLQPASAIRNLDFWLPSLAVVLTLITWIVAQRPLAPLDKSLWVTVLIIVFTILSLSIMRYFDPICCLTATKPPSISYVITFLFSGALLAYITSRRTIQSSYLRVALILVIISLLIILKSPALSHMGSALLRSATGQDLNLASALDISWLGFSYLAFRLLHVLQDSNTGRLANISLGDFVTYALFFPSYTAGPIDRLQRFNRDLQAAKIQTNDVSPLKHISDLIQSTNFLTGTKRIILGIFKKFVLADSLALLAINDQNAAQITGGFWVWVLVYGFSLRIYLDFSGYTDIAIGIGNLLGFNLPENFAQPYQKANLTTFWNSWHITLSQWFRAYFFNPLTRSLRAHPGKIPAWTIILLGQLGTMILIGLWHGISWNFAIWGLWHGFGLFVHNRWVDWSRSIPKKEPQTETVKIINTVIGWFITFNYVSLGWVWFAIYHPEKSISVFQKLFSF